MNTLKKTDSGSYSFLSMGRYVGCDGTTYRWEAPMGQEFFAIALNKKADVISAALTEAAGVQSRFQAITAAAQKQADGGDDAFVAGLESTFGKANVLVQDEAR